jgi:site-specific recombinase XerD
MELFYTGDDFTLQGIPHRGIPFLLDSTMREVVAVNDYLYHIAVVRGRTASPATWKAYAESLYDFFSYLEANDLEWRRVSSESIAVWRNAMVERRLARSTINQRIRAVSRFYVWAAARKLIECVPFHQEEVLVNRRKTFLAHVDDAGNHALTNELTLREYEKPPDFLFRKQIPIFFAALKPKRSQLLAWLMVETGLRREEAAGLACAMLPAPSGSSNAMLRMTLDPTKTPTKGGKARWVQMSPQLYAALWQYREVERPRLAMLYRQKHAGVTDRLFLNRYGDPLSLQGLDNVFRKASDRSGIHCTPHMLRHTFGTYELLRLEKVMNQGNALLWVKERMGHSSIQTTMRYLHLAVVAGQDTLDDYQEAITSMMAEVCRG